MYEFFLKGARRAPFKEIHIQIKQCPLRYVKSRYVKSNSGAANYLQTSTLIDLMLIANSEEVM